jgi:hypothetical protein
VNPALRVLLANVVRCPSRPGTTELDAGHPASVIWEQGDYNYTIGSHIALLRAISPLSRAHVCPCPLPTSPGVHEKGHEFCHEVCPNAAHTHSLTGFLYTLSGLLTRTREPAHRLGKGTTSAQHGPRVCADLREGGWSRLSHHGRNLSHPGQQDSRSVLENVYDVSKSRYGIEEAFLPCKAPLLFRAAPVL